PANALVIDPRSSPGAPNGKLYVATDVGIYTSSNGGTIWQKLGVGLPNVPVVNLQFSQTQDLLIAATQGRGVFTLSTALGGPHVVSISPPTKVQGLTNTYAVNVTFNETIDPTTFNSNNVTLTGPGGAVTGLTLADADPVNHEIFQVTFVAQTNP